MTKPPNFLFFITDQHRFDWLGCTGHPVVRTPHIDAIAQRGTVFDRFHVAMPVCMPNRASLMTGRYPSVHGLRSNGCVLSPRANTFVEVLAKAGFRTAAIGKSHLQPFTGINAPRHGDFTPGPIEEAWKPEKFRDDFEEAEAYAGGSDPFDQPYYGFSHVEMATGHGDQCGGHYGQWFRAAHADWRHLHDPSSELPHNYSAPQAFRTPVPEESYPTAWIGDRAARWIEARAQDEDPFFCFVSFPDPHHPFNPPGRYWDMYSPDAFTIERPYSAHRNPPPPLRHLRAAFERGEQPTIKQSAILVEDQGLREAMALTAGMVTMIDDAVGRVMSALERSGRGAETVVVFNSDHGDYLGDFNMLLKGAVPTRGITQVPFIWSDPGMKTAPRTDALASTVDIAPTILARAGLGAYWGIQGRSLMPVLAGGDSVRDSLLVENNDAAARMGFANPARVRSVLTKDARLSLYQGEDWGELYDLVDDPWETHNLWDEPTAAGRRAELTETLARDMLGAMEESPRPRRLA